MVWSPDSRFLAVSGADFEGRHGIFRIDVENGAVTPIVVTTSADDLSMAYLDQPWSSDSAKFYYLRIFEGGGKGRVLVERDLGSGRERELMSRGTWVISLSRDKRKIYYYDVAKSDNALIERDLASGDERELARHVNGIRLSPDGRFLATRSSGALVIDLGTAAQPNLALQGFNDVLAWAPDSRAVIVRKSVGVAGQADFLFRSEYWWQPLDGRTPLRVLESHGVADQRLEFQSLRPDGKMVVFKRTDLRPLPPAEIWVFEDFLSKPGRAR